MNLYEQELFPKEEFGNMTTEEKKKAMRKKAYSVTTREFSRKMADWEVEESKNEYFKTKQEVEKIEEEFEEVKHEFKERIKPKSEKCEELYREVKTHVRDGFSEVFYIPNIPAGMMYEYDENGMLIREREMEGTERQYKIRND